MSQPEVRNLFSDLPTATQAERFDSLHQGGAVRIERIVSQGQASAPDDWYDQAEAEWVLVLSGAAQIAFEGEAPVTLQRGDHVYIAPHRRHRVHWTTPDEPTVWLAVHIAA